MLFIKLKPFTIYFASNLTVRTTEFKCFFKKNAIFSRGSPTPFAAAAPTERKKIRFFYGILLAIFDFHVILKGIVFQERNLFCLKEDEFLWET
ncbi:MAG: hypothetical protein IJS14_02170 [Lentisphaeria bacterium]|nr:hypothetical protein [Lentisphaeria bacterium]